MDIERLKYKSLLFIDFTGDETTNAILNDRFKMSIMKMIVKMWWINILVNIHGNMILIWSYLM